MSTIAVVPEGLVLLDLRCPRCGDPVQILGNVAAVLTTSSTDAPTVRAKVSASAVPHVCDQVQSAASLFDVDEVDDRDA